MAVIIRSLSQTCRVRRERMERLAVRRDALGRLEAQLARHQRRGIVLLQAEHMRPDLAANPTSSDRFLRESRALAAIRHDHVVEIYDYGRTDDGASPASNWPFRLRR